MAITRNQEWEPILIKPIHWCDGATYFVLDLRVFNHDKCHLLIIGILFRFLFIGTTDTYAIL